MIGYADLLFLLASLVSGCLRVLTRGERASLWSYILTRVWERRCKIVSSQTTTLTNIVLQNLMHDCSLVRDFEKRCSEDLFFFTFIYTRYILSPGRLVKQTHGTSTFKFRVVCHCSRKLYCGQKFYSRGGTEYFWVLVNAMLRGRRFAISL